MLPRVRSRRRWVAVIALFGLLFQQLAMASYVCPIDAGRREAPATSTDAPPCHRQDQGDPARCHQHCHPLAQASDQASAPTVPAAVLPATTWLWEAAWRPQRAGDLCTIEVVARATAPPLTARDCSYQL